MADSGFGRRAALRAGAGVFAGGALAAPMVHAQGTGGTLRFAFWDHWVPGGNDALKQLGAQWAEKNRVNVQLDFINTTGNQLQLTAAAQAQSRHGHDGISLSPWDVGAYADVLEPVDDVINRLVQKYGAINPIAEYLAKHRGAWRGVPATSGTQTKPACVRFAASASTCCRSTPGSTSAPCGRPRTGAARAPRPGTGTLS